MLALKLYSVDYGVYGLTVVVAASKEEAIKLLEGTINWHPDEINSLVEHDIKAGLAIENLGDRSVISSMWLASQ